MEKPITNLLSSFFVNEYLNKYKTQAIDKFSRGISDNVPDAYRTILVNFANIFCGKGQQYGVVYYNTVIENFYNTLYKQFYPEDQFLNFIDRTVLEFLSKDFYNVINSFEKKEEILRSILREAVKEFTSEVLKEHITSIINPPANKQEIVVILKKRMYALLIGNQNVFIMSINLPKSTKKDSATTIIDIQQKMLYLEARVKSLEADKVAIENLLRLKVEEKNNIARQRNQYLAELRRLHSIHKRCESQRVIEDSISPVRDSSPPPIKKPMIFEIDD